MTLTRKLVITLPHSNFSSLLLPECQVSWLSKLESFFLPSLSSLLLHDWCSCCKFKYILSVAPGTDNCYSRGWCLLQCVPQTTIRYPNLHFLQMSEDDSSDNGSASNGWFVTTVWSSTPILFVVMISSSSLFTVNPNISYYHSHDYFLFVIRFNDAFVSNGVWYVITLCF